MPGKPIGILSANTQLLFVKILSTHLNLALHHSSINP